MKTDFLFWVRAKDGLKGTNIRRCLHKGQVSGRQFMIRSSIILKLKDLNLRQKFSTWEAKRLFQRSLHLTQMPSPELLIKMLALMKH